MGEAYANYLGAPACGWKCNHVGGLQFYRIQSMGGEGKKGEGLNFIEDGYHVNRMCSPFSSNTIVDKELVFVFVMCPASVCICFSNQRGLCAKVVVVDANLNVK